MTYACSSHNKRCFAAARIALQFFYRSRKNIVPAAWLGNIKKS